MNILFLLGLAMILLLLRDVFHSAVPRGMSMRFSIAPFLVRTILWAPFFYIASKVKSPIWKAEILGLFPPTAILTVLAAWTYSLIAGIGLISFSLASEYSPPLDSLHTAIYFTGSAVLTLGSSEYLPQTQGVRFLMVAGAFFGMILTASMVSLMFTLVSSIQRREVLVSLISSAAGSPPSGVALLETYSRMKGTEFLPAFFDECHHWCADVLETHLAFPILSYFRSNDPFTSWLTALGAVLDSIALMVSADPERDCFSARRTYQIGCKLMKEFVSLFKLTLSECEEIGDDEFHQLYLRLQSAGYVANSEEATRANFKLLRCGYLADYRALSQYLAVPVTLTTGGDMFAFSHSFPTLATGATKGQQCEPVDSCC